MGKTQILQRIDFIYLYLMTENYSHPEHMPCGGLSRCFYGVSGPLRKIVDQGRTTVVERIEIDGLLIQGTILPTR
jgi:hypothetical protein